MASWKDGILADFDDITGWQEELAAFEATEEGRRYFNTSERVPGKKYLITKTPPNIPLSTVFDLAEQYFEHAELREAIEYWVEWGAAEAANINLKYDDPQYFQSLQKYTPQLFRFSDWYAMKKRCPFKSAGQRDRCFLGSCEGHREKDGT